MLIGMIRQGRNLCYRNKSLSKERWLAGEHRRAPGFGEEQGLCSFASVEKAKNPCGSPHRF